MFSIESKGEKRFDKNCFILAKTLKVELGKKRAQQNMYKTREELSVIGMS